MAHLSQPFRNKKESVLKKVIKASSPLTYLAIILLTAFLISGCVASNQGSHGSTPQTTYKPMEKAAKKIVTELNSQHPIKEMTFQITPNNFCQNGTRLNLPFSEQVSEFISNELVSRGGVLTTQEVDEKPIRVMGTYHVDDTEVIITVKLREMGSANSRDLAHAQTHIDRSRLKDSLFEPQFSRIGNTLIMLLENNYNGLNSLKLKVERPLPTTGTDHEMVVGEALQKILEHSLTNSDMFSCDTAKILPTTGNIGYITGRYGITGKNLNILLSLTGSGSTLLSSASYDVPLDNIPQEYLESTIHSLNDLAKDLCRSLSKTCEQSGINLKGEALLVKPGWFLGTRENAVLPFSREMSSRLILVIMEKKRCTVVNQMDINTRWLMAGNYGRNGEALSMTVTLFQISSNAGETGINLIQRACANSTIPFNKCDPAWFQKDLKGVIHCLLNRLERKSLKSIPFKGKKKSKVLVKKIKYKDTLLYSPFSDYVNNDSVGYFSNSLVFTPIKNTEKKLMGFRAGRTRSIRGVFPVAANEKQGVFPVDANEKQPEPVAAITGAAYYTEGSYWPLNNNQIDMKIRICNLDGSIICSESIITDKDLVDPALFELPQENPQYTQELALVEPVGEDSALKLEVFTQKGRENLMFRKGDELIFYVHTNKDIYLHLYNRDANGDIYRIFPNAFSRGNRIKSDNVAIIPDTHYPKGFRFQVQGHLGNEMVFAFASDHPLPDLPGTDVGNGVQAVDIPMEKIKTRFAEFVAQRGHFLAWDAIALFTKQ